MAQAAQSRTPDGSLRTDIYFWLNKVTLDIIGHAGTSVAPLVMPAVITEKKTDFIRLQSCIRVASPGWSPQDFGGIS